MEYRELVKRVTTAVDHHDPIGLLAMGAPADEYASEISAIAAALGKCDNSEDCLAVVWATFRGSFGDSAGSLEGYRALARELMAIKSALR